MDAEPPPQNAKERPHLNRARTQERRAGRKIAQVIAASGLASRREAELWVRAGRVELEGAPARSPALRVERPDQLRVDGKPLPRTQKARLWRFHKPRGVLVARRDPRAQCLPDLLPKHLARLHPVGRLDLNSEGLLLLTNDATLKRNLENPAHEIARVYRVRVFGRVSEADLARLRKGPRLDGRKTTVLEARMDGKARSGKNSAESGRKSKFGKKSSKTEIKTRTKIAPANRWLRVTLAEGRNREIRKLAALFGWQVNRLIRTRFGEISLGDLPPGGLEEVPPKALAALEKKLSQKMERAQKPKSAQKRTEKSVQMQS